MISFRITFAIPLALACLLASPGATPAEDVGWTQWRGPDRTGLVAAGAFGTELTDVSLSRNWRVKLGPGYSGAIVRGGRLFVTETRSHKYEVVRALDLATGNEIWSTEWAGSMTVPFFAMSNGSWIRSTPALADDDLFVAGMRDLLVCLSADDGRVKWRIDFPKVMKTPLPSFGFVCSPLIDGEFVYVQAAGGFVKLQRETGKIVWHSLRDGGGMYGSAFSSPTIAKIAGKRQAVVQTRKSLVGVDLENGETLWSVDVEAFRGMNILTPTIIDNCVFTSSYGGGSFLFEVASDDANTFSVRQVWRNKVQGYMSSPVVIDGHIYLHLRNQRFACIEIDSGQEKWITQPFGKYWSLIASGTKILALDERGELFLIEASPQKFKLLSRRKVSDQPTWAHVGLSGESLLIRDLGGISRWSWK